MRIAVGGFQHETNTFAPERADYARFERQDGWPGLSRGTALFPAVEGVHLPIAGAIDGLRAAGHEPVPLLWCSATPCAHVTRDAFERITAMILEDLRAAPALDGLYLDLHGAMVCEHLEEGEGELLRRIRDAVGDALSIAVSLDLHANVTQEMVALADLIEIYRTYPHVDMADTGERAVHGLVDIVASGERPAKAFRKTDFCIPLNWGCTFHEPAQSLYGLVPGVLSAEVPWVSLAAGLHLSDIAEMGPAVLAYGRSQGAADHAADALFQALNDRRDAFHGPVYHPVDAVDRAKELATRSARPVVLADTQDNPGGGGPGDTTGLLRALIDRGAKGTVLGLMNDPAVAAACHDAGLGKRLSLKLGGRMFPGDAPPGCLGRGAEPRRRSVHGNRTHVGRCAHEPWADGADRSGRRARGTGVESHAGGRPIHVPASGNRTCRNAHHRAQELGPFPCRLPADRRTDPGGRRAWNGSRGPGRAHLPQPAPGIGSAIVCRRLVRRTGGKGGIVRPSDLRHQSAGGDMAIQPERGETGPSGPTNAESLIYET